MKSYIDKMLQNAERAKRALYCFMEECKDSYLVIEVGNFVLAAESSRSVCLVYLHHWRNEFTPTQEKRLLKLCSCEYQRDAALYMRKYGVLN